MPRGHKKPIATLRQDGKYRFTVKVEFHLDRDDIIRLLAYQKCVYGDVPLTRAEAFDLIQKSIRYRGLLDDHDFADSELADTAKIVSTLFPELQTSEVQNV